jgi:RNA polymerase sigma-70 factor (ECF subfamily)
MVQPARRKDDLSDPDEALIARALAGEEAAFGALYRRHAHGIAALVYRTLGHDADLDDVVQETFVEGFRQLGALSDRTKLRPWLTTIAVRRIHARLAWRYRLRGLATRLFGVAPAVSDPAAREPVHALYRALARAPAKQRLAWTLHRVEGLTLPEAGDHCGVSLATVKRWIAAVDEIVEERHATE